jgi:hypothetical protein
MGAKARARERALAAVHAKLGAIGKLSSTIPAIHNEPSRIDLWELRDGTYSVFYGKCKWI